MNKKELLAKILSITEKLDMPLEDRFKLNKELLAPIEKAIDQTRKECREEIVEKIRKNGLYLEGQGAISQVIKIVKTI